MPTPGASTAAAARKLRGASEQTRYLVVVDAHTQWIEVSTMTTTNPQSNGAAETVKTVKTFTKKAIAEDEEERTLGRILFHYTNCEHATTSVSPEMETSGRRLRGRLNALRPNTLAPCTCPQDKRQARVASTPRAACPGDMIFARDYSIAQQKWIEGRVREAVGPASYNVEPPSHVVRCHVDQILLPSKKECHRELGVQTDREAARELRLRLLASATKALVEAEASKEVTEKLTPGSSDIIDLHKRTLRSRPPMNYRKPVTHTDFRQSSSPNVGSGTRSELINRANDQLLQHENAMNIRGVSTEQDAIRHQTMETAKTNQSSSLDV
ncbi:hypothetical protein EVAR_6666_1 [Eumeta japonica]|uniref:Integrase catalytic domain-containing protein n=1 Tax=Eumeta variegata TaxID=151549 RepID=A0A4C1TKJ4_EUMVA|nr:hypothetical protein EVAR_6666_1 [Eumeta japonica]